MPPRFIERLVGILLPPACREEVLGDLCERYQDVVQYCLEALFTVPMVIASRIRRTTDPVVLLMMGAVSYCCFLSSALYISRDFLGRSYGFLRLGIPVVAVLLTLVLSDAYANPVKLRPLRPISGVALGFGLTLLLRTFVPPLILLFGAAFGMPLVAALRMLYTPIPDAPRGTHGPAHWMKQELADLPELIVAYRYPLMVLLIVIWLAARR